MGKVLLDTKPPEEFRTAGSSYGMFSVVAVVSAALKVSVSVVGVVIAALRTVRPPTLVVYCGTPLRITGWLNTTASVEAVLVAEEMPIGTVGCGRFTPFLRLEARFLT